VATDAPTAFFSYSREDLDFALRLAKDLKKAGANVWMDKLDIRPGQPWQRKIDEALSTCSRVLVILSPSSVDSDNVMAEVTFALDEKKEVIPVLFRECRVPLRLRLLQYVDFRRDYSQGFGELLATAAIEQTRQAASVLGEGRSTVPTSGDRAGVLRLRELRALAVHTGRIVGMALSADGRLAVSASWDHTLIVWDPATGRELRTLAGHTSAVLGVALSADGRLVISASGHALKVWDPATGRELRTLSGHTDLVNGVALTADGRLAVSASWDRTLKVWDPADGHELRTLSGHTDLVNGVALTADGRLAVSASKDKTLKVWDPATGRELRTLAGHTSSVTSVAMGKDGRLAVSGSWDKMLKVWKVASGRELRSLAGHTGTVWGVASSGHERLAVSASDDKTLKVWELWELSGGRELATFEASAPLYCCTVCPDSKTILAGDDDGVIHVLRLE